MVDTERMVRTIKEELVWARELDNPGEFGKAFSIWVDAYSSSYLHSSLGYMPPCKFEMQELKRIAGILHANRGDRVDGGDKDRPIGCGFIKTERCLNAIERGLRVTGRISL